MTIQFSDRHEEHGDRPEDQEDEERDREDQAEEDSQPVALEVVFDHEFDWMFWLHTALMPHSADVHSLA